MQVKIGAKSTGLKKEKQPINIELKINREEWYGI